MLPDVATERGFVYLDDLDDTIHVCLRYAGYENFLARPVSGYRASDRAILTLEAARALKRVQSAVNKDGYGLMVYDAYRPQCAVDEFLKWGHNVHDIGGKRGYYPHLNKAEVFRNGYVATRSSHSRGSTVDVTLISVDAIQAKSCDSLVTSGNASMNWTERELTDGTIIPYLEDGTVDMGSSFDLFHEVSHTGSALIVDPAARTMRQYLHDAMAAEKFVNLPQEWWHYTLHDEPHVADADASYFNFVVQ